MRENRHTKQDLQQLQALPLNLKIRLTQQRIREWVNEYGVDGVYVSFSGGKDSSVLLHIARQMYPEIKAVFSNTGIEFPEIVKFVSTFSNVDVVRPTMPFVEVVKKYGYPMISKEVSECVSGARKYLTRVIEENSIAQTDRQTGHKWHYQKYRQLYGFGNYASVDARKQDDWHRQIWQAIQFNHGKKCGGEYAPWRFGAVVGILTPQNTFDARLWKDYHQQFASPKNDGNQSEGRQSNDGDYP